MLACILNGQVRLLAAGNDGEICPMDIETQITDVVGLGGIETDIRIVVGSFHS